MGCRRGVGGVPLLRWAGRSGRGEHRRRKTQCEYRCANPPGDALHSGGIAILLLAHVIRSLNSSRRIAHQPQLGGRAGNLVETPSRPVGGHGARSEEHTSELQSLMRISYAVFVLKKKK